jgi:hypothetical protein
MMLLSISLVNSFANLNTYNIFYMRDQTDPSLTYADFIFISQGRTLVSGTFNIFLLLPQSIFVNIGLSLGFTCYSGGMIAKKISLKATLITGALIFRYMINTRYIQGEPKLRPDVREVTS